MTGADSTIITSPTPPVGGFNYSTIDPETADALMRAVDQIKNRKSSVVREIIGIGTDLIGAKARLDHGQFGRWLEAEFDWDMTDEEGKRAGVDNFRLYFRAFEDKGNMAPPADKSDWYRLQNVELGNGDNVGVVTAWTWPDAFAGMTTEEGVQCLLKVQQAIDGKNYRHNSQAKEWIGIVVADVLGFDANIKSDRARITSMIKTWVDNGSLVVATTTDEKGKKRPVMEVGKWAND